MKRRAFLAAFALAPLARAEDAPGNGWWQEIARLAGARTPRPGRVRLEIPENAENGNSVALTVSVDGPMLGPARVTKIHLVSELNPYARMATFRFGPGQRRAQVVTRVKLAGTQRVHALAELADGSIWSDSRFVNVAFAACLEGS